MRVQAQRWVREEWKARDVAVVGTERRSDGEVQCTATAECRRRRAEQSREGQSVMSAALLPQDPAGPRGDGWTEGGGVATVGVAVVDCERSAAEPNWPPTGRSVPLLFPHSARGGHLSPVNLNSAAVPATHRRHRCSVVHNRPVPKARRSSCTARWCAVRPLQWMHAELYVWVCFAGVMTLRAERPTVSPLLWIGVAGDSWRVRGGPPVRW